MMSRAAQAHLAGHVLETPGIFRKHWANFMVKVMNEVDGA